MVSARKEEKKGKGIGAYLPYAFAFVLFAASLLFFYTLNTRADFLTSKLLTLEQRLADFESAQPKPITVKIYYVKNCSVCSNFTDMLAYLQRNSVNYELVDVLANESEAAYAKQIGISFFPTLLVFTPDAEANVGLYKLTQDRVPTNDYYPIRLGSVGVYPWGNKTNQTYFFYSETCQYSAQQKVTLASAKINYTSVCIQIHTGDDQKCKDIYGSDEYLEFERLQSIYKVKETPTLIVDGKYIIVGYQPLDQFNEIMARLKNI